MKGEPIKAKAMVVVELGRMETEEFEVPAPEDEQILIRSEASRKN